MRHTVEKGWLVLMIAAVVCTFLAPPAAAEDRYWVNWFGGDWVDPLMVNWQTSTGVPGLPGPADRALIVLPYPLVGNQPVFVSTVNPGTSPIEVNTVIIESGNWVSQQDKPYYPRNFPDGYNLNLTSNTEIIGGSGESFTAPPGYFGGNPSPPPITPTGAHYQSAGTTNTVNTELILGNIAGSQGTYGLSGGSLNVGKLLEPGTETIGYQGTGIFTHTGGNHTVHGDLKLGWGWDSSGTYELRNTGILQVSGAEKIGVYGTGSFFQQGTSNTANSIILAQEVGSQGTYGLSSNGNLNAIESMNIGTKGQGTFTQQSGTVRVGLWEAHFGELTLGDIDSGRGTYYLNGGLLEVYGTEYIGRSGVGTFEQTAGRNRALEIVVGPGSYSLLGGQVDAGSLDVGRGAGGMLLGGLFLQNDVDSTVTVPNLVIGQNLSDKGLYTLGAGTLNANTASVIVGGSGKGDFLQTGGVAKMAALTLGSGTTGIGAYDLRTDATLTVAGNVIVGASAVGEGGTPGGSFRQSDGTHQVNNWLILGQEAGSTGAYTLSGGALEVGQAGTVIQEVIGLRGKGAFEQTNGTHTVYGNLILGGENATGDGTYLLTNGDLVVTRDVKVGDVGAGRFEQSGGNVTVAGNLSIARDLTASLGTYVLRGDGKLDVGGTTDVYGSFEQSGGSFKGNVLNLNNVLTTGSSYLLSGTGNLEMTQINVGTGYSPRPDRFEQSGGSVLAGELIVSGTYVLSEGRLEVTSSLLTPLRISYGSLEQSGGILIVSGEMANEGSLTYSGGSLTAPEIYNGLTGRFIITGSPGPLNANITNANSFGIQHTNVDIDINGDVVNKHYEFLGDGASVSIWDSTVRFNGNVVNEGAPSAFGGRVGEYFWIFDSRVDFNGTFNNDGVLNISNSTVRIANFINSGRVETDPSHLYIGDFLVTSTGYVKSEGDFFHISGNFTNNSTQNTLWDTSLASLIFENAVSHNFYLAGLDLGATADGFLDNFAWGSLSLGEGGELHLFDGNLDTPGAALYLGLLTPMDLDDIYSAFNVYYNATLAGNSWLGNSRYALHDGGYLIPFLGGTEPPGPEPVPEPSMVLVWASGLAMLGGMVWRRHRRG